MANKNSEIICSKYGDVMNHHADTLIHSTERNVTAKIDPSLGDLIEESHNCPGAGPSLRESPSKPIQRRSYL